MATSIKECQFHAPVLFTFLKEPVIQIGKVAEDKTREFSEEFLEGLRKILIIITGT
jgi:hypothetical protein